MKFYRGILVPKVELEEVRENILQEGILGTKEKLYSVHYMKEKLKEYFENPNLSTLDTRPSKKVYTKTGFNTEYIDSDFCVCCSGHKNSAAFYANRGKESTEEPLVIEFEADIKDVFIDSRDFLASCFSNPNVNQDILKVIFGEKVLLYYNKAKLQNNRDYVFAMLDLVCQDEDVIRAHYNNQQYMRGRYNVEFVSAFMVKAPIKSKNILDVYTLEHDKSYKIDVKIEDIRG